MSVVVITPPEPIVSLAMAKKQLRVEPSNTDDDDLIALQIAAAQASIDGPGGWLGRAVGLQELEYRLDGFYARDWLVGPQFAWEAAWPALRPGGWPFSRRIELPCPPFVSVTQITYEDMNGVDQVLTPTGWAATDEGVTPPYGKLWPSGRVAANAVRIQYKAGYVADDGVTPSPPPGIAAAILMMVADLYENRQAQVIDARAVVAANPTVSTLLSPFRIWRV